MAERESQASFSIINRVNMSKPALSVIVIGKNSSDLITLAGEESRKKNGELTPGFFEDAHRKSRALFIGGKLRRI